MRPKSVSPDMYNILPAGKKSHEGEREQERRWYDGRNVERDGGEQQRQAPRREREGVGGEDGRFRTCSAVRSQPYRLTSIVVVATVGPGTRGVGGAETRRA